MVESRARRGYGERASHSLVAVFAQRTLRNSLALSDALLASLRQSRVRGSRAKVGAQIGELDDASERERKRALCSFDSCGPPKRRFVYLGLVQAPDCSDVRWPLIYNFGY